MKSKSNQNLVVKVVKGTILGFLVIALTLPGFLTGCGNRNTVGEIEGCSAVAANNQAVTTSTEVKRPPLTDIKGHWAERFIQDLYSKKIISGEKPGIFNPDKSASRAEFISLVVNQDIRVKGVELEKGNKWYSAFKKYAFEQGWLPKDYTEKEMESPMGREEMAYILSHKEKLTNQDDYSWGDIEKSPYKQEIMNCIANGYLSGKTDGFKPLDHMTKAECATVLYKAALSSTERMTNLKKDYQGNVIRKTNLPKNSGDYEYILAKVPNVMYENRDYTKWKLESWTGYSAKGDNYKMAAGTKYLTLPKDIAKKGEYKDILKDKAKLQIIVDRMKESLELRSNIDYRTIDYTWADKFYANQVPSGIEWPDILNELRRYVDYVKEHKIVVKSDKILVEPSMVYSHSNTKGELIKILAYVRYEIISCDNLKDTDEFNVLYGCENNDFDGKLKPGRYEGYEDREMGKYTINKGGNIYKISEKDTDFTHINYISIFRVNNPVYKVTGGGVN